MVTDLVEVMIGLSPEQSLLQNSFVTELFTHGKIDQATFSLYAGDDNYGNSYIEFGEPHIEKNPISWVQNIFPTSWGIRIDYEDFHIWGKPIPFQVLALKFTSGFYMGVSSIDFERVIKSVAGGPAAFEKSFDGRLLKGITCPGSVDNLPNLMLKIGEYNYTIEPRSYAFMEIDEDKGLKRCFFMIYEHDDPAEVYTLFPENYLKGV